MQLPPEPIPLLFGLVMGRLTDEVRQGSPWPMMCADDHVICSKSREQVVEIGVCKQVGITKGKVYVKAFFFLFFSNL